MTDTGSKALEALPPLVSTTTKVLILGSFPGAASLRAQQYYGHPRNHFWPILQAIWPYEPMDTGQSSYENRSKWLLAHGLGVWDVYASCERDGSLDSNIRNAVLNDFSTIKQMCPALLAIAHNGGESFRHSGHVMDSLRAPEEPARRGGLQEASAAPTGESELHEARGVEIHLYKLPSTSPANASWNFQRKLDAWRKLFEKYGLA